MLQVDLLAQRLPEEISLRHRRLWTHLHLAEKCRILTLMCQVPANLTTPFRPQSSVARAPPGYSGPTKYMPGARTLLSDEQYRHEGNQKALARFEKISRVALAAHSFPRPLHLPR